MQTGEFVSLALDGASNYLHYLSGAGKGREILQVEDVAKEGELYLIKFNKKPYDVECLEFAINGSVVIGDKLKIIEYDNGRNVAYLRVSEDYRSKFEETKPDKIYAFSDMRFLTQRLCEWYTDFGKYIFFPPLNPCVEIGDYVQNDLSNNQKNAVSTIFSTGASYIWGAPGTGKTKYVLSESLLQYYRANRKVVVLAPTNNAIEQVLYGLLERLQSNGADLKKIIRLGTPSVRFASKYGMVCEIQGVDRQLEALKKNEKFLKAVLQYRFFLRRLDFLEKRIIPNFDLLLDSQKQLIKDKSEISEYKKRRAESEQKMHKLKMENVSAEEEIMSHTKVMNTARYAIWSRISRKAKMAGEAKLDSLLRAKRTLERQIDELSAEQKVIEEKIVDLEKDMADADIRIDVAINELKEMLKSIEKFEDLALALSRITVETCYRQIMQYFEEGLHYKIEGLDKYKSYSDNSDEDIEREIEELRMEKEKLEYMTSRERTKGCSIIAATIDTFLTRFQPNDDDFKFSHIFLDEAGYCSLIKAMPLFGYGCAVTMLGDHLQLPPVCEIDDSIMDEYYGSFLFAQSAIYAENVFAGYNCEQMLNQYLDKEEPCFGEMKKANLNETYRFGKQLVEILEKSVYKNGFCSATGTSDFVIEVLDAARKAGGGKRQNISEAEVILQRVKTLGTDDYAILTPYRNQVSLISSLLPKDSKDLLVMTVHASQGREWDTVFLSVTDTSDKYFTNSKNRKSGGIHIINTAVSRARRRLIIVCDVAYWIDQTGQLFNDLIKAYS